MHKVVRVLKHNERHQHSERGKCLVKKVTQREKEWERKYKKEMKKDRNNTFNIKSEKERRVGTCVAEKERREKKRDSV